MSGDPASGGDAAPSAAPGLVLTSADAVGGVWTYALELARGLAARGVRTALAVLGPGPSEAQRAEAARVPGLRLLEHPGRLEWMDDPWEDVEDAGRWLLGLERELRPDVVHLNGYAHAALPWRAPTLVAAHSCVPSWWRAVKGEAAPPRFDRYRAETGRGLRAADLVIAPTRAMLDALEREHGPLERTAVIPNGRDPAPFAPAPKEPLIASVGRLWDEAKNVALLARAAPGLPWTVAVAGEPARPGGGAAELGGVRPLGVLAPEALAALLGRAGIYALPARYEPFGLSALEAALSGCALVLGDIPSLREVWGDAARFVPPDDATALRGALLELIRDDAARLELAGRARERARRYAPGATADAYLERYRALLRASDRAPSRPPGREVHA